MKRKDIKYSLLLKSVDLKRLPQDVRNALKKRRWLNVAGQRLEGGVVIYRAALTCSGRKIYAVSAVGLEDVKERFIAAANAN